MFRLKIHLADVQLWSVCVCVRQRDIIQLFCLVFCVVRAVGEFDFWLVINEKKNYVMQ